MKPTLAVSSIELKIIFYSEKAELYSDGRLEVYNHLLANRLNRHLKVYDDGKYRFKKGEEGVFKIPLKNIQAILMRFLVKAPRKRNKPRSKPSAA